MKRLIIVILILGFCKPIMAKSDTIDGWIQEIVNGLKDMNDLKKFSSVDITDDVKSNFLMVESVKDITIKDGYFTMLVNHGSGEFCTQLKFHFIEKDGRYYLVFSNPETKVVLGSKKTFVNPWVEKKRICD